MLRSGPLLRPFAAYAHCAVAACEYIYQHEANTLGEERSIYGASSTQADAGFAEECLDQKHALSHGAFPTADR